MTSKPRPGLRARLAMSLNEDSVAVWKRAALDQLRQTLGAKPRRVGATFQITPGFLLVCGLAALPLAGGRAGVAALALLLAMLVQEAPALLLASGGGVATLKLDASGARASGSRPLAAGLAVLAAALGALLNLMLASLLVELAARAGLESRLYSLSKVTATILVAWGVCQLLPVAPFRNGLLLAQYLPTRIRFVWCTFSLALVVSGGALLVAGLKMPSLMVVVAASAAFALVTWRDTANQLRDESNGVARLALEAELCVQRGAVDDAVRLARAGLGMARSAPLHARLYGVLAWGAIGGGDPFLAHAALQELSAEAMSVHLLAAYLRVCGRLTEAEALLQQARSLGHRSRETTQLLIEVKYALGDAPAAEAVAEADAALLSDADLQALRAVGWRGAAPS